MRTNRVGIFVICLIFLWTISFPSHTYAQFNGVSARNAVLIEQTSGRILYGKLENEPRKIASITKIMTALLAIESGRMDEMVSISNEAVRVEGSAIYLKPGQKVKLKDLVYGLMLRSGNDAATAIAENVGGSVEGFVYLMNKKAEEIGMKNTHFSNPHGLDGDGNHYSSAYDMALLTRYAMNNGMYRKIAGTKSYQSKFWDYPWKNKNKLLTSLYEYSTGGKTGFTKKAGRTLVSTASKEGMDLVAVTLNASSDWQDHMYLFDTAFKNYVPAKIMSKGPIAAVKKEPYKSHVYLKNDFMYPLTEEEKERITVDVNLQKTTTARKDGDIIGKTIIYMDGEAIGERNVFYSKRKLIVTTGMFWNDFKEVFSAMLGVRYDG
ncbi:D-alanyl-D-alanine carboxypeptidase family protein [Bacillus sp. 165]|uniref:D-alanyl-D-alanine carboxypeptidase family protein n=1 Tax=Bacillus sp. 165 TaxID=1529117 RepID=UPI001ADA36EB|nr:D-alanyl-D-alanine carboxypeptidase family protein [Bacillus sp. 165]MBO9128300.1 D-alanyl-D-alanine carboxypeptidase [Bacillus sp. 165]